MKRDGIKRDAPKRTQHESALIWTNTEENTEQPQIMPNANNLRPAWRKGESGNPKGRPKQLPELQPMLARLLSEPTPEGIEAAEAILRGLIKQAAKGNTRAAELILRRAYGDPPQRVELNAPRRPLSWFGQDMEQA